MCFVQRMCFVQARMNGSILVRVGCALVSGPIPRGNLMLPMLTAELQLLFRASFLPPFPLARAPSEVQNMTVWFLGGALLRAQHPTQIMCCDFAVSAQAVFPSILLSHATHLPHFCTFPLLVDSKAVKSSKCQPKFCSNCPCGGTFGIAGADALKLVAPKWNTPSVRVDIKALRDMHSHGGVGHQTHRS